MREIVAQQYAAAPRQVVWARYCDVAGWPDWDLGVTAGRLNGEFTNGTRGTLTLGGGRVGKFRLSNVETGVRFTDTTRLPLMRVITVHELRDDGVGTQITHRVRLRGPMPLLLPHITGGPVRASLPATLTRLARLVERSLPVVEAPGGEA